jgi:integrase
MSSLRDGVMKRGKTWSYVIRVIDQAHRRRQLEDLRVAGDLWVDTGHVFTAGFGQPIYPDTVSQLVARSIKAHNEPADDKDAPNSRCHMLGCTT